MSNNKYEDWDKIIEDEEKENVNKTLNSNENKPIQNNNVNPFMTGSESFWMWALFIGGGFFIWRGLNVVIGIGLNLFIGFSLFIGGVIILVSVKNRIRTYQNIPHVCTNCGKTMYLTSAQENYVKSGNVVTCPHCRLNSK